MGKWIAGILGACVACCAVPFMLGTAVAGAGFAGWAEWGEGGLIAAVIALVAVALFMRLSRKAPLLSAGPGCGSDASGPSCAIPTSKSGGSC